MTDTHSSLKLYLGIYLLLLVGLVATVAVAYVPLGAANVLAALTIAFIKATLVVLYFMHVRDSPELTRVVIGAGFVWLSILLLLVLADYKTRDWIPTREPAGLALPADDQTFQPPREAAALPDGVPHAE